MSLSNTIGFDDAPFDRLSRDRVPVVGAVFADRRFDGVLIGDVARDGDDARRRVRPTGRALVHGESRGRV